MNDIKVSVIIPVYGVEKYIEKCVRSLFGQTMREGIEFIVIDDCTEDNSIEILKNVLSEYPHRTHQVRIIRNEINKGIAETRSIGIEAARGEYVIHCDSDDWVAPEMYEVMYEAATKENADVVGCDVMHIFAKKHQYVKEDFSLPKEKLVSELLNRGGAIEGYLWNRMVKRNFYLKNNFRARRGTTLFDDMAVTVPMHALAKRVAYVPKALYFYRRTDANSMSSVTGGKKVLSSLNVLKDLANNEVLYPWRNDIFTRLNGIVISRLFTTDSLQIISWLNIEREFIKSNNISLNLIDEIRCKLVENGHYKLQYYLKITFLIISPSFWKSKYLRSKKYK